jgi:FMN reductase
VTAVVVGNPKPGSRTLHAARYVATQLTGSEPDVVIDLAEHGPRLLAWDDPTADDLVREVASSGLVVFASPTYKATYTGLLKLFLDRVPGGGLRDVTAVPMMLGAAWIHALAPEVHLRPTLVELGATVPVRSLYVLDSSYDDPSAYTAWLDTARPAVGAHIREGALR